MRSAAEDGGRRWLFAALLVGAGFVFYFQSFHEPFAPDDGPAVVTDRSIRSLKNSGSFFAQPLKLAAESSLSGGEYRPLVRLSYALNYAAGGLDPFGWRLFNLGVYLLNAWLVLWIFLDRFEKRHPGCSAWPAFVCAAAFLVHPLQAQTLASVSQRPYLMGVCFCLLTWIFHARAKGPSAASVGFYIAMHFCKESAVAGAPFFWLWEAYSDRQGEGRSVRALRRVWPYIASSLGFLALKAHVLGGPKWTGGALGNLWLAAAGFLRALPGCLSSMDWSGFFGENAPSLLGAMVVMTFVSAAVLRRPRPLLSFGMLLSFALLAPISSLMTAHAAVGDWFIYFAVVGFCMALGDFAFWSATPALRWVWGGALAAWAVLIPGAFAQGRQNFAKLSSDSLRVSLWNARTAGSRAAWRPVLLRDRQSEAVSMRSVQEAAPERPGKDLLLAAFKEGPDKVGRPLFLYAQAQRGPPFDASAILRSRKAPCSPENLSGGLVFLGAFHLGAA